MTTAEVKSELYRLIESIDDIEILKAINLILARTIYIKPHTSGEKWEDLPEALQSEINEGLSQADNNEVTEHELVMEKYAKWL